MKVVYIPHGADGAKVGADDYLVAGGTVEQLKALAVNDLQRDLTPVGRLLTDVKPERVSWLWQRRIPLGKLTLIDGDPGTGTSALTTDLAARVSAGRDMPDDSPCGFQIISSEDWPYPLVPPSGEDR